MKQRDNSFQDSEKKPARTFQDIEKNFAQELGLTTHQLQFKTAH